MSLLPKKSLLVALQVSKRLSCKCYAHATNHKRGSLVVNSFQQVSKWLRESKRQPANGQEVIGTLHLDRSKDVQCDNLMCDGSVTIILLVYRNNLLVGLWAYLTATHNVLKHPKPVNSVGGPCICKLGVWLSRRKSDALHGLHTFTMRGGLNCVYATRLS